MLKTIASLMMLVEVLALSGCQNIPFATYNHADYDKIRFCRPGSGIVYRTLQAEKVDPIRMLKDSEHGCR